MELYTLTVHELQQLLNTEQVSAEAVSRSYLERIAATEAQLNCFVTRLDEEQVLDQARRQDQTKDWPGLAGIPYALKDIFCTAGVRTTCCSKILENFIPPYDADSAARLKTAQGLLVGKLNMDEFAMGSSTEHSAFGPTANPWDTSRVPGGSSGGSAACVAAGQVPFALGTDTGGSIRQPASFCGVVGLKPTYGRVSRWGVIAFASSLDQVGTFTRDVEDCALVMNIIAGKDQRDSTSVDLAVPDYREFLYRDIKGLRIAWPREYFQEGVHPEVQQRVFDALKTFERLGAIVEEVSLPHSEYALSAYYIVAPAEASANLARFDGVRYGLRDLSAGNVMDMMCSTRDHGFGDEVKRRIMLGTYALSSGYYDAYYLKALKTRQLIADDFDAVFRHFDLIVAPTTPTVAFPLGSTQGDPLAEYMNDILTVPINMAGLPGMSIPCGLVDGLPVGLQLVGRAFDEGTMLQAAHAFEQNTDFHKLLPSLGVK